MLSLAKGWQMVLLTGLLAVSAGAQTADELYRRADESYREFTWDRAIEGFTAFVAKAPDDPRVPEAEYKLLDAKLHLRRYDDFAETAETLANKYRKTVWGARLKVLWAKYLYERERWSSWEKIASLYEDALRDYRAAIGRRPLSGDERQTYVSLLFDASEFYLNWYVDRGWQLADKHLQTIVGYNLGDDVNSHAWFMMAQLKQRRQDDRPAAMQLLLKIVRELPDAAYADDALYELASMNEREGDFVLARARFLELRRRYPKSPYEDDAQEQIQDIEAPRLGLSISQTHLPNHTIPTELQTRNLKRVSFTAYRIDVLKVLRTGQLGDLEHLSAKGEQVATWQQDIANEGEYKHHYDQLDCPLRNPGVYLVEARADVGGLVDRALLNLSSLVLVQQSASEKLVSYVASRATIQPVSGVDLHVFRPNDRNNDKLTEVATGRTDADGLWTTNLPTRQERSWHLLTVGEVDGEYVIQDRGLYTWWRPEADELEGYLYTDRPVYRPGNVVKYRGIVRYSRAGEFKNIPNREVKLTITSPRGEQVQEVKLQTDAYGSVNGELTLPNDPALGVYNLNLELGKQNASGQFRVEEYRKPEFKVVVGAPLSEVRPGEGAAVPIDATYYFGAPVADAELKYVVIRQPYRHWYWFPGPWDWFYAGWRSERHGGWGQQVVTEGTTRTDDKGRAIVEFKTTEDDQDYTYSIQAEVADVTRRVVSASGSVTITQKGFFLFANAGQGLYKPGDDATITFKAENADGGAVKTDLTVDLYKLKWIAPKIDPKTKRVTAEGHYIREAKVWAGKTLTTDPDSGEARLTFKAPDDGYYEAEATAPDTFDPKQTIVAKANFWTAADAWKGRNYDHANLQLITEKDLYEKGQTARVLVNSPVPNGVLLFTVGAEHIDSTKVVRMQGNTTIIELPIKDTYAPNIYLHAVIVGTNQVYFATKSLMVPPSDKLLKVTIGSDQEEYKPRTQGKFTVTTTDANGKPVAAQVSLGITDESVYAIQDEMASPIGVFFYGHRRGDAIRTAVSFEGYGRYGEAEEGARQRKGRDGEYVTVNDAMTTRTNGAPPPSPAMARTSAAAAEAVPSAPPAPGGAGIDESVTVREFFPDTIRWLPTITTDAKGQAEVTVDFPDSLTTWRATARAITKDTDVGQEVSHVVTTKDLIVRLQAPRFFTQLDQSTISVVVTNKTDLRQQVAVGLKVEGLDLQGGNETVTVEPRGQARVDRKVIASAAGEAVITVTATGPNDSDGVKQEFTVVPHGADKFAAAAGQLGADGSSTFNLDLPAARRDDATKLSVTIAPTLAAGLLDALPYLVQYPYGCVEQTTSKFIPCVLVANMLSYTGKPAAGGKPVQVPDWWKSRGLDDLPEMVDTGLKRLAGMQNDDGGYGWFSGMRSDPWMTSYVVYGLMQARLADFSVPDGMLLPAIDHLYRNLHLLQDRFDSTAYVAWVLAEAAANQIQQPSPEQLKIAEDAWQRVYANRDDLNDYTRALLCLGLTARGEQDKAAVVWRNIQAHRIETEHGVHWGENRWGWRWSENQVEATAYTLLAALKMDPDGELARKAVAWLVLNREGNRWYSTKDTAAALFALVKYAEAHDELGSSYTTKLLVNGQEAATWQVTPQNALSLDGEVQIDPKLLKSGANTLELVRDGKGSLYYSAMLEYYTLEDPITAASNYLSASRKYYRVTEFTDPKTKRRETKRELLTDGQSIASGEQLEVEVTIEAENDLDYVCLEDPKPAGCEPVDTKSGGVWSGTYLYRELHDRTVAFFVDHLSQGKTTLTYRLRAETPGVFRALPHHGFAMYRPDVRCLSDEAIVRVGERVEQ